MSVIDEPAVAVAASRCLTARTVARRAGDEWTPSHPRTCAWCDYPTAALARLVDGFNAWAGAKDVEGRRVYARYDVQRFAEEARRHPDLAEAQIVEAQGLVAEISPRPLPPPDPRAHSSSVAGPDGEVEPVAVPAGGPAHDVDPELEAWT